MYRVNKGRLKLSNKSTKFLFVLFCFVAVGLVSCGQKTIGETFDDSVIATKVETKLLADTSTSALSIDINVYSGIVQLSGLVDSEFEKQRAEEIAKTVSGVVSVRNDLIVNDKPDY